MEKTQRIEPGTRMSQAVVHGDSVYLAGQVGDVGTDIQCQMRAALAKVDRLLAAANTDKSRVIQATIWLADMADFSAMNTEWEAWVDPASPPARATGEVKLADPGYKVEVIVVAAV